MCKRKPGARCAQDARKSIAAAKQRALALAVDPNAPLEDRAQAARHLTDAYLDYYATRTGQREPVTTPHEQVWHQSGQQMAELRKAALHVMDPTDGLPKADKDAVATAVEAAVYARARLLHCDNTATAGTLAPDIARRERARLVRELDAADTEAEQATVRAGVPRADLRPRRCPLCGRWMSVDESAHACPQPPTMDNPEELRGAGAAAVRAGTYGTNPNPYLEQALADMDETAAASALELYHRGALIEQDREAEREDMRRRREQPPAPEWTPDDILNDLPPVDPDAGQQLDDLLPGDPYSYSDDEVLAAIRESSNHDVGDLRPVDATQLAAMMDTPTPDDDLSQTVDPVEGPAGGPVGFTPDGVDPIIRDRVYSDVDRTERLDMMRADLTRAIDQFATQDGLRQFLDGQARSRIPNWTLNNRLFAGSQLRRVRDELPDDDPYKNAVPLLMSAPAWKREYGAIPRKGTRAIWIMAPITRKRTRTDPATGEEHTESFVGGGRAQAEFDISQVEGPNLPPPTAPLLDMRDAHGGAPTPGTAKGLIQRITAQGYTYEETHIPGTDPATNTGVLGYVEHASKRVVVDARCTPDQRAAVIAHELGHIMCGHTDPARNSHIRGEMHHGARETEAESFAYYLMRSRGAQPADSEAFSVPYITGWSNGDMKLVEKGLNTALKAADTALDGDWPDTDD